VYTLKTHQQTFAKAQAQYEQQFEEAGDIDTLME